MADNHMQLRRLHHPKPALMPSSKSGYWNTHNTLVSLSSVRNPEILVRNFAAMQRRIWPVIMTIYWGSGEEVGQTERGESGNVACQHAEKSHGEIWYSIRGVFHWRLHAACFCDYEYRTSQWLNKSGNGYNLFHKGVWVRSITGLTMEMYWLSGPPSQMEDTSFVLSR